MAVINNYVDTNILAGKLTQAALCSGAVPKVAIQSFVVASTDAAGSVYRIFKDVPSDAIITALTMFNDALTGATSVNVGLYNSKTFDGVGAIVGTGDQFMTATDISAGTAITATTRNAMTNLSIANREKQLWDLAGAAQYPPKVSSYDICMTMTAMTTGATGNVSMRMEYVRGV